MVESDGKNARYSVSDPSGARRQSNAVERSRVANSSWAERRREMRKNILGKRSASLDSWKRETHVMAREDAREFARSFLRKYPKAAYWSEVESWRVLENDTIEFTMRRLPSAD